jgi:hypothetical protein
MSESRERFSEAVEIVRLALTQDRFFLKRQVLPDSRDEHPAASTPHKSARALLRRNHPTRDQRHHGPAGLGMLVIPQKP